MAKDWEYAQMAKTASEAGGPDAWIETIKDAAYNNGASDMKNKLSLPLLLTGIGLGTAGVIGYQKIKNWIVERKAKKLITKQEAIKAETLLKKELEAPIEELESEATNKNVIQGST